MRCHCVPAGRLTLKTAVTARPGKGVEKLDLSRTGSTPVLDFAIFVDLFGHFWENSRPLFLPRGSSVLRPLLLRLQSSPAVPVHLRPLPLPPRFFLQNLRPAEPLLTPEPQAGRHRENAP